VPAQTTHLPKQAAVGIVIVAAALAIWVGALIFPPAPPRTVVMYTGPEGGTYFELGKRYREILARSGIDLRLVATAGAVDNMHRLADSETAAAVGFVQGGSAEDAERRSLPLASLGTLFFEPLWFIHAGTSDTYALEELRGKRVAIGAEGSGTRALARRLLAVNRIDDGFAQFVALTPTEAAGQLLSGELGAAFISSSWDSPVVQRLLTSDRVGLYAYSRADAYVALFPFLTKLTLPTGVADMARNLPPHDVTLFAPKASLVVRKDLHSAIQYLLLQAAAEIHSHPDIFQTAVRFPAPEADDFPLSEDARQYYKSGPPWLQRYLPFWLAVLAGQAIALLIPLGGIIYPLLRGAPALYLWSARRRIYRLYRELKGIEHEVLVRSGAGDTLRIRPRLIELEERASQMRVPSMYGQMLYTLKMHIALVRNELEARAPERSGAPT
jgi:TRAP transporter TAXI family solute receptor